MRFYRIFGTKNISKFNFIKIFSPKIPQQMILKDFLAKKYPKIRFYKICWSKIHPKCDFIGFFEKVHPKR